MSTEKDRAYWANYYESGKAPEVPSHFSKSVLGRFVQTGSALIELGCGNGRDARFFAGNGVNVRAVDLCEPEVGELQAQNQFYNLRYEAGDFTRLAPVSDQVDAIYSRFTLHSVDEEGQDRTLKWSFDSLVEGGHLLIETRGQRNEIYKLGEAVEGQEDAFVYEGHYRRFVEFNDFIADIKQVGFEILEAVEDTGFAPYQDTDYHFIRVVARK